MTNKTKVIIAIVIVIVLITAIYFYIKNKKDKAKLAEQKQKAVDLAVTQKAIDSSAPTPLNPNGTLISAHNGSLQDNINNMNGPLNVTANPLNSNNTVIVPDNTTYSKH